MRLKHVVAGWCRVQKTEGGGCTSGARGEVRIGVDWDGFVLYLIKWAVPCGSLLRAVSFS